MRPTGTTAAVPQWVCSTNHQHHWQATLGSRIAGSDCPECPKAGKSRVELDHHEAAVALFGSARSGALVRNTLFRARPVWSVDILVGDQASAEQRSLVIEYDGAYWHGPETKRAVDEAKSTDLLEAGYFVVRLRERPLPALEVEHPRYLEVVVSSTAPRAHATITLVQEWFSAFSTNAPSET